MSREIKFRAWNIKHKQMFDNVQNNIQFYDGSEYEFKKIISETDQTGNPLWIVMQYIRKDKSGAEIYEDDIVQANSYGCDEPIFARVVWRDESIMLRKQNQVFNISAYTNFKLLGNIYENPELLEKT